MKSEYTEQKYLDMREKYLVPMPGDTPLIMREAKGAILKDINGKEYIDGSSLSAGPTSVGSSHPRIVSAVIEQVKKLSFATPWFANAAKIELAAKLSKITPGRLNKFYFLCSGGEAAEFAIKNAIKSSKKKEVIGLYTGYHGATIACLSLGHPWHRRGLPTVPGFRQIPQAYCYRCFYGKEYPNCDLECAKALENMIQYGSYDDVAAFILEPMQGGGGHIIPPKEYFRIVREICDRYGVLLIFDEIQTGFGRCGKMWAADYYEVVPDIMVIGKAMGGGIPISGAVFREDMKFPSWEEQEVYSTFSGSPISCAAASVVVDVVIEEDLPQKAFETGAFMMARLNELKERHPLIGEVRGQGLFIGVELVKDRKKTKERAPEETGQVLEESRKKGVILMQSYKPGRGNVVLIKPPLSIGKDLAARIVDVLDESLSSAEGKRS